MTRAVYIVGGVKLFLFSAFQLFKFQLFCQFKYVSIEIVVIKLNLKKWYKLVVGPISNITNTTSEKSSSGSDVSISSKGVK